MRILLVTFLSLFLSAATKKTPEAYVTEVVGKLQKSWDNTKNYKANFKQVIFSKRMGTRDENTGVLYVIKPTKLRWESKTDGTLQILNGNRLINVTENKRRGNRVVDIFKDVKKVMDTSQLQFLSGKAKFEELYNIKLVAETAKQVELKLTPKGQTAETYVAEVDKTSYFLRSLTTENADSRVRIEFIDTKINVPMDDKLFTFTKLETDVVHEE